jgi:hypothetical protein
MGHDFGIFPLAVSIDLDDYDGPAWHVAPFRHRSGWLMASEATMETPFGIQRRQLVAAISERNEVYPPWIAAQLLQMPMSLPMEAECEPPDQLEEVMDGLYWDFLGRTDGESLGLLMQHQERNDAKIRNFERQCAGLENSLWAAARALRRECRQEDISAVRRDEVARQLDHLFEMRDELALRMTQGVAEMRLEMDTLEEEVFSSLTSHGEVETACVLHWTTRSRRRGTSIHLPVFQEESYSADAWRNRTIRRVI